jgi:hypothetical protein
MLAVPVKTYLRPGGGGTGRSDHDLMLIVGDEVSWPPPSHFAIKAAMMVAARYRRGPPTVSGWGPALYRLKRR